MARVLFASFDEIPSFKGACTHILSSFRKLHSHWDITLISLGANPLPRSSGIRHLCFSIDEKNYLRRAEEFQRRLREHLLTEKYDLGHFRSFWEGTVLLDFNIPTIFEVNALTSIELPETFGPLPEDLMKKISHSERHCLFNAKKVSCPSERTADFLASLHSLKRNKICVLPNGFDKVSSSARRTKHEKLRLAYVGTLHPWQGLLWSLRSFRELPIELHLFSPTHRIWTKRLHRRIQKYGLGEQVILHEPMPKFLLQRKLAEYDLGFSPLLKVPRNTTQGCCPIKNLDYLSSGLPVLASDLFVNRQFLLEKKNCIFFTPSNRKSLDLRLNDLLDQPEAIEALARETLSSLDNTTDWDHYSEKLGMIYEQLYQDARNNFPALVNNDAAHP